MNYFYCLICFAFAIKLVRPAVISELEINTDNVSIASVPASEFNNNILDIFKTQVSSPIEDNEEWKGDNNLLSALSPGASNELNIINVLLGPMITPYARQMNHNLFLSMMGRKLQPNVTMVNNTTESVSNVTNPTYDDAESTSPVISTAPATTFPAVTVVSTTPVMTPSKSATITNTSTMNLISLTTASATQTNVLLTSTRFPVT